MNTLVVTLLAAASGLSADDAGALLVIGFLTTGAVAIAARRGEHE